MATTITVDRDTRAVLHQELKWELTGAGDTLHHVSERDKAGKALERAAWALEQLDDLGWDEDDERDRYELEVDDTLVAWLRQVRAEMETNLDGDRENFAHLEAGDEGHCIVGRSLEESVILQRHALDLQAAALAAVERLLGELGKLAGAVA